MYFRILNSPELRFKTKLKRLIEYQRVKKGSSVGWEKRFKQVFIRNPNFNQPINASTEKKHLHQWSVFSGKPNFSTLRLCSNNSGISDVNIVPEEIFATDIEYSLNGKIDLSLLAHKSMYPKLFKGKQFPQSYIHNMQGILYDGEYVELNDKDMPKIVKSIKFPVIFKPNTGTYGGYGVYKINNHEDLLCKIKENDNYVVQEYINQDSYFEKFNDHGINTIRVNVYRSVVDNKLHVLNAALRLGVGGSLDNETAGGIVVHINRNGRLCGVARDKYANKFNKHPDNDLTFDSEIPLFSRLIQSSLALGKQLPFLRLMSFDMCLDTNKKWRAIEVNTTGQTIRFAQYAGEPFFREFTDEVIHYCKKNHWALRS